MKLLCITDLHGNGSVLQSILNREPDADVIILGGDLTHFGTPEQATGLIAIARQRGQQVLAVAGNCDSREIDEQLVVEGVSVHARGLQIGRIGFLGVSAMPPWGLGYMYQFTEAEIDLHLAAGFAQVAECAQHVFISHAPPRNCGVDRVHSGANVGSRSVRQWIEKITPRLVICGHIHEGRGVGRIGQTPVVNCGHAKSGYYAIADLNETADECRIRLRSTDDDGDERV